MRKTRAMDIKQLQINDSSYIKTHDSESRGQEAGRTRDEQVSYLHVVPL